MFLINLSQRDAEARDGGIVDNIKLTKFYPWYEVLGS